MINFNRSKNFKTLQILCFKYNCYAAFLKDRRGKTSKIVIECINRPFHQRTDFPVTLPTGSMDFPDWKSIESSIIDFSLPYLFNQ